MTASPWKLCSAEIQGSGHKRKNIPCQDKTYCNQRNRVKVVALADGAGSAALSHFGAECVTKAVSEYVIDNFLQLFDAEEKSIKADIASVIRTALSAQSAKLECKEKDLSSTFLLAAVRKDSYIAIHIGDGVIGNYERDTLKVLSAPENGEYANMTWFTTTTDLERVIRVYRGNASIISGFVLMSDGVEPSLYDRDRNELADATINLIYTNAKIDSKMMSQLLQESLEQVISLRTRDDCSIALLSRTRFKNFQEYSKFRKKLARRNRKSRNGR
jgi:hypothetical protein